MFWGSREQVCMSLLTRRVLIELRRIAQWRARRALQAHDRLWRSLQEYRRQSSSTGCNHADYWHLYAAIRRHKPAEILECGTGISTLVIATALEENEREHGISGRVTSMEEHAQWLDQSRALLPERLRRYVEFCLSPTVEDCFSLFRGVRYREVPERPYDFVFVDGPNYQALTDGAMTFDFDLLHLLRRADWPVSALIDKRVSTCYVLQQLLGPALVKYSPVVHLGFVAPSTKHDLSQVPRETPSRSFDGSFRVLRGTRLSLNRLDYPHRRPLA
jgi:predicted O-methyltransferase YrrM